MTVEECIRIYRTHSWIRRQNHLACYYCGLTSQLPVTHAGTLLAPPPPTA